MRPIVTLLALLSAASAQAAQAPVHTQKTQFRIPYRYDAAEMRRIGALEIRLFVSADRGTTWRHVHSVAPAAGRFDFVAPGQGEFWFNVRTLDGQNQLYPPGQAIQPGLKVIVDSTPPQFAVDVRQLKPGRVQLSWRANDPYVDTSTLKLEYRQSGGREWKPVSVIPQTSGSTSWSVPQGGGVAVRGSIGDRAKNTARAEHQTTVAPAAAALPRLRLPDDDGPIASQESTGNSADGADSGASASAAVGPIGSPAMPIVGVVPETSDAKLPRISGGPSLAGRPAANDVRDESSPGGGILTAPVGQSVPPLQHNADNAPATGDAPAAAAARVVNVDRFEINYEIGDVGPSGVGAVEFYITRNGGRQWFKLGDDLDRRSPFEVKVPGDGTYGFEIRVRSGVGLAAAPPQPGDSPSIVVAVDQTPPVVRLYPAQQGQGASLNKILIRWKAEDENPAPQAVSLAYSAAPSGPWTTISDWSENTGSYLWTVDETVASRLFIALSVRDAAGNVRRAVTPNPVVVDLKKPSARIIGVKPPVGGNRR